MIVKTVGKLLYVKPMQTIDVMKKWSSKIAPVTFL